MSEIPLQDFVRHIDGLFVGQLSAEERLLLELAVNLGYAVKSYESTAGFLGLAKVRAL